MKTLCSAVVIVIVAILCSCEKNNPTENSDFDLLTKVLVNGELFKEYTYNESNLLAEEKTKLHYTRHTYDGNNQLIQSEFYMDPAMYSSSMSVIQSAMERKEWANPNNTEKELTQQFEYNNVGMLLKKNYIRPRSTNTEYLAFEYENDRISKQNMYFNDVLSGYINYYYDGKGNLSKMVKYRVLSDSSTQLLTTTEYEYDDMKNPFRAFRRLITPGTYTNQNNITKETYTIHFDVDPSVQRVSVIENDYEYNRLGYPVRVNGEAEYIYR
jgi:hypothetical protein